MAAFALTADQRAFAAEVRSLGARELAPLAEAGEPGRVNRELIKAMGRFGLLARLFPGVAGGQPSREAPATDLCLLRESLATQSTEAETALALQGLGSYPVLQSGQAEQVRRWLPAVAAGDAVAAFALSEPGAGSDAAALELAAEPDGSGWRLTGQKMWISNAPEADFYTVFARTTAGARARGVSAFVVPADRPGLSGEHLDMVSPHPIGTLSFDGVPVLAGELLGERDRGFAVAMRTLDLFRPSVGAFAVGMAQAALDAAVAHASARVAFGGPLKASRRWRTCWPRWRPGPRRPGCWCTRRPPRSTGARPPWRALGHGQAAGDRDRPVRGGRGGADPRRAGAAAGPPARAPLPRGPGAAHLRGRVRDPAHHHRPRAAARLRQRPCQ